MKRATPCIFVGLWMSLAGLAARAGDWPQWRGRNRDGHTAALPQSMPPMELLWKQPVAGACHAGIAVAGGTVVLPDHDAKNDYYRAYQAADGMPLWTQTFPNGREMDYKAGPRATPLVHRGKVYVLGAFGEFYCLDLKTGKTLWEKDFSKDFGVRRVPTWGHCSSPLVAQGKLILNPGGKAGVVALAPDTGEVLWQCAGRGPNYSSFIAATFGGVEQAVGYDARSLGGWDLKSGKRLWTVDVDTSGGYLVPTPLCVGGKLLITDQNNNAQLFAFGEEGVIQETPVAQNDDLAPEVSSSVAAGDLILGQSERLVCLDAADNLKTLWTEEKEKAFEPDCHLIVASDRALAFNSLGVLVLFSFDRREVKVLGKRALCGETLAPPALADGRFYVRDDRFVYCFRLMDVPASLGR